VPDNRLTLDVFIDTSKIDKQLQSVVKKSKKVKLNVESKGLDNANSSLKTMAQHLIEIPKKMVGWMLAGNIISAFFSQINSGIDTIFALDSAMTNINMTMELTNDQQQEMVEGAFDTAQAYNSTAESVLRVTQIFSNLSETVDTLNSKVETTIALANITQSSAGDMADAVQGMG